MISYILYVILLHEKKIIAEQKYIPNCNKDIDFFFVYSLIITLYAFIHKNKSK